VAVERQREVDHAEEQRQARRDHQREFGHRLSRMRTSDRRAHAPAPQLDTARVHHYCTTRMMALPGTVIVGRTPMKFISGEYDALVFTCVYNNRWLPAQSVARHVDADPSEHLQK